MGLGLRIKSLIKLQVRLMEATLPKPVFQSIYEFSFPKYQATVRQAYLMKGVIRMLGRNQHKWKMTQDIYEIMPYTLVGIGGLEATYQVANNLLSKGIAGDFVELGVARGGCAALMGSTLFVYPGKPSTKRRLWLFDSFEGLPDPTQEDYGDDGTTGEHVRPLPKGACLGTLDEVKNLLLNQKGFPEDKIVFVKNWFQDTISDNRDRIDSIALLRIDGDWYESTKVCMEGLYDKVTVGGAIIVDDYQSCYGCKKAVDEFLSARNLIVNIKLDGRGGCYFYKT